MQQYGAWTQDYYLKTPRMGEGGGRIQFVVESIQEELRYNGFLSSRADRGVFDTVTRAGTIDFQRSVGLKGDGIVGPNTARSLCQKRIYTYSNNVSVNPRLTAGIIRVASGYDFGAVGFVYHDARGLGQIRHKTHPSVTDDMAFSSPFSIKFIADYLRMALRDLKDDECAVASYYLGLRSGIEWCKQKDSNLAAQVYVANVLEGA